MTPWEQRELQQVTDTIQTMIGEIGKPGDGNPVPTIIELDYRACTNDDGEHLHLALKTETMTLVGQINDDFEFEVDPVLTVSASLNNQLEMRDLFARVTFPLKDDKRVPKGEDLERANAVDLAAFLGFDHKEFIGRVIAIEMPEFNEPQPMTMPSSQLEPDSTLTTGMYL